MNLGWRAADAEYVFFLHDDTEADPGAAGCDLWPASVIPLGELRYTLPGQKLDGTQF